MTIAPFDRSLGQAGPRGCHPVASSAHSRAGRCGTPHSENACLSHMSGNGGGRSDSSSTAGLRHLYSRSRCRTQSAARRPGPRRRHRQDNVPRCSTKSTTRKILELAGNIPRIGRLPDPDATATAHSKLCGSTVTIDLKMDGETVTDFAHDVKACALGQASSSIMARNIVGAKADELRKLREDVRRMLKENGAPPATGRWADIAVLEPVRDYKARHASTLLTFDAVVSAIDQIAAKRGRRSSPDGAQRNPGPASAHSQRAVSPDYAALHPGYCALCAWYRRGSAAAPGSPCRTRGSCARSPHCRPGSWCADCRCCRSPGSSRPACRRRARAPAAPAAPRSRPNSISPRRVFLSDDAILSACRLVVDHQGDLGDAARQPAVGRPVRISR